MQIVINHVNPITGREFQDEIEAEALVVFDEGDLMRFEILSALGAEETRIYKYDNVLSYYVIKE